MSKTKDSGKISNGALDLILDPSYQALVERLKRHLNGNDKTMVDIPLAACVTRLREYYRKQCDIQASKKVAAKTLKGGKT